MTSSLVGSEMCIRDRMSTKGSATKPTIVWRPRVVTLLGCTGPIVMAALAVSYTHLTLPTICSV
eukprot:9093441-Prorocentrum_lima.AAC.1